jgi:hypothetical protein
MGEKLITEIINALPGILVGALITYVFAVFKLRKELAFKYDTDLREKRITEYLGLWRVMEDLAKYARPKELTFADLEKLAASLREWYFQKGGLFLSDSSRDSYFDLQEAIKSVLASHTEAKEQTVSETIYEELRQTGSTLRTALVRDVGTRQEAKLN